MTSRLSSIWKPDDEWIMGFLDEFPGWCTQERDIPELESMLLDLYDLCDDEASIQSAKIPDLDIPPEVLHGVLKVPVLMASLV